MTGRVRLPAGLPLHVLREYAVLADGERAALVGPRGEIVWLCAPQWHDDPVFGSLIGGHGTYAVTPLEERYVWGGYYATTPGLFTEEFDVRQRQLRGNLPQAFVHAGLLEASARLAGSPAPDPHPERREVHP